MAIHGLTTLLPRVALYSLLTAIEEDVRMVLIKHLEASTPTEVLGEDLSERARARAVRDLGECSDTLAELLPYVDFADVWQLVSRHHAVLPPVWPETSKRCSKRLERLSSIRNRVMHSRPLDFDDLPTVVEFATMIYDDDALDAPLLHETVRLLEDNPAALLDRGLPISDGGETHNLPFPDFDETGFIGRREVIEHIKGLCLGAYPVVTIVGDGGLGKTAAALKVAYELLDDERSPFDAVVWSTSKTTQLTARDILDIEGAISTSLGLMEAIALDLGASQAQEPMEEVLDYLEQFRILLILDNLETVLDDRIRSFLTRMPIGSKLLITSRIGLGSFEHPVKLPKLSGDESVQLIRSLAQVRGVGDLLRMENRRVARYCQRMDNNPLWIKWFVSGVQAGVRPESLLADPEQFLEFSMSNVYKYLSDSSREVLQTMQVVPGKKSQAELAFITGFDVDELQGALGQLSATNMVTMASTSTGSSFETHYELAELPRTYLAKRHPVDKQVYTRVTKKQRQLNAAGQELRQAQKSNPYLIRSLDLRSSGNLIVAKHLLEALDEARHQDFVSAEESVAKVKRLAPEWYEVHRVEALVKSQEGNITGAQQAFEAAIELEPGSAPLRLRFGMFKLDRLDDPEGAIDEFLQALDIDPQSLDCRLELVRAHQRDLDFEAARRQLSKLFANESRLSQLKLRMLWDLELQQWMRLADKLSLDGDHERSSRALESMRRSFQASPDKLRDERIRRRLLQALPTARRVTKYSTDPEVLARARDFVTWVDAGHPPDGTTAEEPEATGLSFGAVVKLVPERGYGFIRLRDGDELFFHFSQLQFNEADVTVGDELLFELGAGRDGAAQALQVRRA
jgi:cold shock CspA family protein/tetratricopeptide (TPR) repeat protein